MPFLILYVVFTVCRPALSLPCYSLPVPGNPSFRLSPLFATLTGLRQNVIRPVSLTPLFSVRPFRSSLTLFTLVRVSSLFATLTKSTGGWGCCPSPHLNFYLNCEFPNRNGALATPPLRSPGRSSPSSTSRHRCGFILQQFRPFRFAAPPAPLVSSKELPCTASFISRPASSPARETVFLPANAIRNSTLHFFNGSRKTLERKDFSTCPFLP